MVEEKGEIFRKSLCCEPFSDSDDRVSVSDAENHKTTKQLGKTEGNSTKKRKKESHKKVRQSQ